MELKPNKNQKRIIDFVQSTSNNVLICGKPGTGKSVLIHMLTELGPTVDKHYTLAAPTGLAALNIGGRTLHSIFRLPTSHGILAQDFNNFAVDQHVVNFIRYQIKHLIIDEISMVRADMFDFIDRFMREVKGNDLPFGGVQVILVGDFYQLPPVVVREEVTQLRNEGYSSPFVFSSKAFQNNFKIMMLDEVLRQKGDPDFIDLLDSARDGSVHPKSIGKLNKQVGLPDDIRIKLTGTNKQADEINQQQLSAIDDEPFQFQAIKYGEWPVYPVEEVLALKVGAQVMVKMNGADRPPKHEGSTKFTSKVVNGTLGVVKKIISATYYEDEPGTEDKYAGVNRVIITKDNGENVTIFTKRWERKKKEKVDGKWEEVVLASYEQIPLALAWAISIHKSQGQSFDKVHVDLSRVFAPGQAYVALSRCRSMAGLSLQAPVTTRVFWANRDVMQFFEALEGQTV